jgi:hypothetical protein
LPQDAVMIQRKPYFTNSALVQPHAAITGNIHEATTHLV